MQPINRFAGALGRRRRLPLFAVIVSGLVALTACGSVGDSANSSTDDGAIVIGLNLEMSGPGSFLGEGMKAGIDAAVEKINTDGGIDGRQIEIISKDNQSDPSKAASVVSELKREGAQLVIGPGFAQDCAAAAPIFAREDLVGFCMSAANLPEEDSHMFGVGIDYATMEQAIAQQFADADVNHVGVLAASDTSGGQSLDNFESVAKRLDIQVDSERFNSPANNLTPQMGAVNRKNPQAIRLQATGSDALVGIANIKSLGITAPVWLPNSAASGYFADQAKDDVGAGNIYTWIPAMLSPTGAQDHPNQAAQIEGLLAALPQADTISASGWDAMQIAAAAIDKADSTDTDELIEALENGEKYYGAYSVQQITADDHRGASDEGTLLPARFTTEGTFELADIS